MIDPLNRLAGHVGAALDRAVDAHHRRRLRALGWSGVFAAERPAFIAKTAPPTKGNQIDVLIDGAEILPAILDSVSSARHHVHVAGWHLRNQFSMLGPHEPRSVHSLLTDAARRAEVRVLLWAGSPLPVFHPTRSEVKREREELIDGTGILCALDANERPLHCHHEKLVIVDGETAFVGGLDLTDLGGDRWDNSAHPPRTPIGWHDVAVRIRGPLVHDVAQHFATRWNAVTGESLAPGVRSAAVGTTAAQLVRTVPEKIYPALPRGDFSILAHYIGALRGARRLIYLESQFLWSPEVVTVLKEKLLNPPCDEFRMVVMLPARPFNGALRTLDQLGVLMEADGSRGRFLACTVGALDGDHLAPVYVHAKVGIIDDRWMTIGSANLNDHSLFNDTEVNVVIDDAGLARSTRMRLWAEHLRTTDDQVAGDPVHVVETMWRPIAEEQLRLSNADLPRTHPLVKLAPPTRHSHRFVGPIQGLIVDG